MNENSELNDRLSALITRCANGDKDAFADLYQQAAPQLLAAQVRILGMNPTTERALHDTFSRVWLQASEFGSDSGRAMTWLTSIARNHALNLKRARGDGKAMDSTLDETAEMSAELADISFLENNPDARELLSGLNHLDELTRVSIVTAYLDGLSLNELGEVYNLPVDELRTAIHNGMLSLRGSMHAPV